MSLSTRTKHKTIRQIVNLVPFSITSLHHLSAGSAKDPYHAGLLDLSRSTVGRISDSEHHPTGIPRRSVRNYRTAALQGGYSPYVNPQNSVDISSLPRVPAAGMTPGMAVILPSKPLPAGPQSDVRPEPDSSLFTIRTKTTFDLTGTELEAWACVSHYVMMATINSRSGSTPHTDTIDLFMQKHMAALNRILYLEDFAEEVLVPQAMMVHMMIKDMKGFSIEKQMVYLKGLVGAFEATNQFEHSLVLPDFAQKMDEGGIKVSAEVLEREKNYPSTLLKLALHSSFDAPAKISGPAPDIIGSLFPDLPPTHAKGSIGLAAPAFTVSFADISTVGIRVSGTYSLDEHLKITGNTVKIFCMTPAVVFALRSYRRNRMAVALGIEGLGDEILASWNVLLGDYKSADPNIFTYGLEMDMDRVHKFASTIRFSKMVQPSIFAERGRKLRAMIHSRRLWHSIVMSDMEDLRLETPQRFYGAILGVIAFCLWLWRI